MLDQFNLFRALELKPTEKDPKLIRKRLDEKIGAWNRLKINAPGKLRAEAKSNLSLVPELEAVLADPERLAEHARESVRLQQEARMLALEELRATIELRSDSPDEEWVAGLVRYFSGKLEESEVRKATKGAGGGGDGRKSSRKPTKRLDQTLARRIRDDLGIVGKETLYELLELPPQSSSETLLDKARQVNDHARKRTDEIHSARARLAGHCLKLFKGDESRARYDATVADQAMDDLKSLMSRAINSSAISSDQFELLVARAVSRGVARKQAEEFLLDEVDRRGWRMLGAGGAKSRVPVCGVCFKVADVGDSKCTNCSSDLEVACPNPKCDATVATDERACAKCGFKTGDLAIMTVMLREGEKAEREGRLADAKQSFQSALSVWAEWAPGRAALGRIEKRLADAEREEKQRIERKRAEAEAEKKRAEAIRAAADEEKRKGEIEREEKRKSAQAEREEKRKSAQAEMELLKKKQEAEERRKLEESRRARERLEAEERQELEKLERALGDVATEFEARRLRTAQKRLDALGKRFGEGARASLQSRIEFLAARIEERGNAADRLFREGRRLQREERDDEAYAKFVEAHETNVEDEPTLNQLKSFPPPAPTELAVRPVGRDFELTWKAVSDPLPVTYRVTCSKNKPPSSPEVGETVADGLPQPRHRDTSRRGEGAIHYAVFSRRAGVFSKQAATSGPHMCVEKVRDLKYERGKGFVRLSWKLPKGSSRVEVWRKEGHPPEGSGDGVLVPSDMERALDEELENDATYWYLILAIYGEGTSAGSSASALLRVDPRARPLLIAQSKPDRNPAARVPSSATRWWEFMTPGSYVALFLIVAFVLWLVLSYALGGHFEGVRAQDLPPGADQR